MSQSAIRLLFSLEALWAIAFGALACTAGIRGVRVPGRAFNRVLRPGRAGRERIEAMIDLWSVYAKGIGAEVSDRVWRDSDESRRAFTAVVPGLFYTWAPLILLGLVMDLAETPLGRAPSAGERADTLAASVFIMVFQLLGVLDYYFSRPRASRDGAIEAAIRVVNVCAGAPRAVPMGSTRTRALMRAVKLYRRRLGYFAVRGVPVYFGGRWSVIDAQVAGVERQLVAACAGVLSAGGQREFDAVARIVCQTLRGLVTETPGALLEPGADPTTPGPQDAGKRRVPVGLVVAGAGVTTVLAGVYLLLGYLGASAIAPLASAFLVPPAILWLRQRYDAALVTQLLGSLPAAPQA